MTKTGEKQGEKEDEKDDGGWKLVLMAPVRAFRSLLHLKPSVPAVELVADKGYGGDRGDGGDHADGGDRLLADSTDGRSKTTGSIV